MKKLQEEWRSYLEARPDYVQAIGMISIENANLEIAMADLLGAVLGVRDEVGNAIYLTPRAAILRLEILEAVAKAQFRPKTEGDKFYENEDGKAQALRNVVAVVKRAKSAINRRHTIIHDAWGIEDTTGQVIRASLPLKGDGTPESLRTLKALIGDLRKLITDTRSLSKAFRLKPPVLVDMRI